MYKRNELIPLQTRVTPRTGLAAQLLAIWSTGYDYPVATFIWNTAASRALSNRDEVKAIVDARVLDTGEDYETAFKALVLESGMFRLAPVVETGGQTSLPLDPELIQRISDRAEDEGLSIEELLRRSLNL